MTVPTLIVETGLLSGGTPGANTYVNAADFLTYAGNRGITIQGVPENLLIEAMDYIENQSYKGRKNSLAQLLVWPRYGVTIDSWPTVTLSIPQQLINGQCEVAIAIDQGNSPLQPLEQGVKSEMVAGVIQTVYQTGSSNNTIAVTINNALRKILSGNSSGGNGVRITKA